jgi:hypothetical protein
MPSRVLLGKNGLNQLVASALEEQNAKAALPGKATAQPKLVGAKSSGARKSNSRRSTKEARRA